MDKSADAGHDILPRWNVVLLLTETHDSSLELGLCSSRVNATNRKGIDWAFHSDDCFSVIWVCLTESAKEHLQAAADKNLASRVYGQRASRVSKDSRYILKHQHPLSDLLQSLSWVGAHTASFPKQNRFFSYQLKRQNTHTTQAEMTYCSQILSSMAFARLQASVSALSRNTGSPPITPPAPAVPPAPVLSLSAPADAPTAVADTAPIVTDAASDTSSTLPTTLTSTAEPAEEPADEPADEPVATVPEPVAGVPVTKDTVTSVQQNSSVDVHQTIVQVAMWKMEFGWYVFVFG